MNAHIDLLRSAALDPFCVAPVHVGPMPDIDAAGPEAVANGTWWMCEGCCDPGPDEFPEDPPQGSARAIE
jgi:hypothetical protein